MLKNFACIICLMALAFLGHASDLDSLKPYPISFENTTGQTETYALDLDRWAYADFYYRVDGGPLQHKRTGLFVPYRERDHSFLNLLQIRIELKAGQALEGELHLVRAPYLGPPPRLKEIEAISEALADQRSWNRLAFSLIICLVLLFIFFYNLLFYSVTRNKLYRYYLPSVFFIFLETLRETGLLSHLLGGWDRYPELDYVFGAVFTTLFVVSSAYFLRDLLHLPQRFPFINRLFFLYIGLSCLVFIVSLFDFPIALEATLTGMPMFLLLQFYVAAANWQRGYKYGFVIFLLVSVLILATALHLISLSGLVAIEGGYFYSLRSLAMALVDTCMAFMLGKMVWDMRKENIEQQKQIISALQRENQAQVQIAMSVSKIQEQERQQFAVRVQEDLQNYLASLRFSLMGLAEAPPASPDEMEQRLGQLSILTQKTIAQLQQITTDINPLAMEAEGGFAQAMHILLDSLEKKGVGVESTMISIEHIPIQIRYATYQLVDLLLSAEKLAGQKVRLDILHLEGQLRIILEARSEGLVLEGLWAPDLWEEIVSAAQVLGGSAAFETKRRLAFDIQTTADLESLQIVSLN